MRRIVLLSDLQLLVPEFIFEEFEKHLPEVSQRAGLTEEKSRELLNRLRKRFVIVPEELVTSKLRDAMKGIGDIDAKDAPYLAAALAVASEGIWSDDPHMKRQRLVACHSTRELVERLREEGFAAP